VAPSPLNVSRVDILNDLPEPANSDAVMPAITPDQKIISWLFRMTVRNSQESGKVEREYQRSLSSPFERTKSFLIARARKPMDDWQTVASIIGLNVQDLLDCGINLPITAAEIDHFRRNHRETDRLVGRDFLALSNELPTPVADLYGLYRHRARLDTEASLFVAQATGSTRIPRIMADLLAIAAFASGHECIAHATQTYSVPAAFDTSDLIDRACDEAHRRILLPIDTPAHLLKLTPDEISILANNIVERHAMSAPEFLQKARILSEARQDVHRMPVDRQYAASLREGDIPEQLPWAQRINKAYRSILPGWLPPDDTSPDYAPPTTTMHIL
jgi:hypothetical protein